MLEDTSLRGEDPRRYERCEVRDADQWTDRVFIAANMRPIGARNGQVMLACWFYDRDHNACRAYEQRPPMCRDYPWYDHEEGNAAAADLMAGQCSFLLDVPPAARPEGARPLIPITVVRRQST